MSLIQYLPTVLQDIKEYEELFKSLDVEVKNINNSIMYAINQASILNADEYRVKEWEKFLDITPLGDLYQRKLYIVSVLTTVGKLNKSKIEDIVRIYTNGGGCIVTFADSTIKIQVKPPNGGEIFRFDDIERVIDKMKPAHLLLSVVRFYSKYKDIPNYFNTYEDLKQLENYRKLKFFIGG